MRNAQLKDPSNCGLLSKVLSKDKWYMVDPRGVWAPNTRIPSILEGVVNEREAFAYVVPDLASARVQILVYMWRDL
jgi:hypothetical protein